MLASDALQKNPAGLKPTIIVVFLAAGTLTVKASMIKIKERKLYAYC